MPFGYQAAEDVTTPSNAIFRIEFHEATRPQRSNQIRQAARIF
jgi:hypothetical protein